MALVILDRDGVINVDSADYIKSESEWEPIAGSIDAIALICNKGYRVYVATNQAGLARGLFQPEDLAAMHEKLVRLVEQAGGEIAGIMYCPHHPNDNCRCRKPKPGMLEQIARVASESVEGQYFVGDSVKDIQAAAAVNAKAALVLTGNGAETQRQLSGSEIQMDVFKDLSAFAHHLPKSR